MSKAPKCPKCGETMEKGTRFVSFTEITLAKEGQYVGARIIPFVCKNCGYIELYKEKKA